MATDLVELQDSLNLATGKTLDELFREEMLVAGVAIFNAHAPSPVLVDGTLLDRDLNDTEKRIMVLCAILAYLDGEILKASLNAIIHRNDAGRTDLSQIPLRLTQYRDELFDNQVKPLLDVLVSGSSNGGGALAEAGAVERGETLPYSPVPAYPPSPYAVPASWPYGSPWPWRF